MTRFGVQIEKAVSFRGAVQPFSNTYYYEAAVAADNDPYLNDLLDDIIPLERDAHSTLVSFLMARVWTQVGGPSQNEMRIQRPLTGTGSLATSTTGMDRERAFLIRLRAGVDSRGRPVYLRKWFHLMIGSIGGAAITQGQLQNTEQLTSAQRAALVTLGDNLKSLTPGAGPNATLVSKNGRAITGATQAHAWLEHHQLGDVWRGS